METKKKEEESCTELKKSESQNNGDVQNKNGDNVVAIKLIEFFMLVAKEAGACFRLWLEYKDSRDTTKVA